jgi:hypothetical protein
VTATDPYDDPEDLDEDLDPEPQPEPEQPQKLRREIAKRQRQAEEAEARAVRAERELALRDSGLDLSDPRVKFFADKYDGDPSAEAITAAATAAGFIEPPPPDVSDKEVASHAEVSAIVGGADAAGSIGPEEAAYAEAQALGRAGTPYKVAEIYAKHGLPVAD